MRSDVEKFGWHVLKIFSDTESAPSFAYTVGLEKTFDHPELVIFGLNDNLELMHKVLNSLGIASNEAPGSRMAAKKTRSSRDTRASSRDSLALRTARTWAPRGCSTTGRGSSVRYSLSGLT